MNDRPAALPADRCIPMIVRQHAEESAHLRNVRARLLNAPDVKLSDLSRHDERLAAHLDGLAIAGAGGWRACEEALEKPEAGVVFAAAVRAIEDRNAQQLSKLLAVVLAVPDARRGFLSAFGWVASRHLQGTIKDMLVSESAAQRWAGVAACAMHRVDPGVVSRMREEDSEMRARALRTAGELGKSEVVSLLAGAIADADPGCQFWAAWSAVLLGDRVNALEYLCAAAIGDEPWQPRALQLALQAMRVEAAHALLQQFSGAPDKLRTLIRGAGLAGDPAYVPWLIGHMADDKMARVAGEAFSMITGLDLAALALERALPGDAGAGPNEDPEDPNVDMDDDEGLTWPDASRVEAWWAQHGSRFSRGTRYFVGATLTRGHCIDVLKNGYQRQRIAAAYHLSLLDPGTPLFEWRAPAWRQQQELARLV